MIDPNEKGVITRTQNFSITDSYKLKPRLLNIPEKIIFNLPVQTVESLFKLEKYELPSGVKERLRQKKPFDKMTDKHIEQIIIEFKKFIAILVINNKNDTNVQMVSDLVDEVWHAFILFTNQYKKFCDDIVGRYIHHEPNVTSEYGPDPLFAYIKKRSIEFFYEEYEKYFGPVPKIWKTREKSVATTNLEKIKKNKLALAIIIAYTISALVIIEILVWNFYENYFQYQVLALGIGAVLVIASGAIVHILKNEIVSNLVRKCSTIIVNVIVILTSLFMVICWSQYAEYVVIIAYSNSISILSLIAAFSSNKSPVYQKKGSGNGAIWTGGCGGVSAGCGASGAGCGGGGGGCCG